MRLNAVRHDWRKLPHGYLSDHSPACWWKVARKPRLLSEGKEGTLLKKASVGTSVRLFSHALYLLKQDRDSYCIGMFPPQLSASSYVLKLDTTMPVGRGSSVSHYFVCSMYQLGTSNLRFQPHKHHHHATNNNNSVATTNGAPCTFAVEAFEPDTNRECIPFLVDETVLLNACQYSVHGVRAMEGMLDGGWLVVGWMVGGWLVGWCLYWWLLVLVVVACIGGSLTW
jgi:hypothetical protein